MTESIYSYIVNEKKNLEEEYDTAEAKNELNRFLKKKIRAFSTVEENRNMLFNKLYDRILDSYTTTKKIVKTTQSPQDIKKKAVIQSVLRLEEEFLYSCKSTSRFCSLNDVQERELLYKQFSSLSFKEQHKYFSTKIQQYISFHDQTDKEQKISNILISTYQTDTTQSYKDILINSLQNYKRKHGEKTDRLYDRISTVMEK